MDWWMVMGYLLVGGGCFGLGMLAMEVIEDIRAQRRIEQRRNLERRLGGVIKLPVGKGRPKVLPNIIIGEWHE